MKRIYKDIKTNYKAPAKLYREQQFVAEVPCQVWLPRHTHERPFLLFESMDKTHKAIGKTSSYYDVLIELPDLGGRKTIVAAKRMFTENFCISYSSGHPVITFQGEPEVVTENVSFNMLDDEKGKSHIVLYLTDNFLLAPSKSVEKSYTGEVKIENVRTHKASIGPFPKVTFDEHYYDVEMKDGGHASYSKLVATFDIDWWVEDAIPFEKKVKPLIDDYLLLASFAANKRTNVVAWSASNKKTILKTYYGNIFIDKVPNEKRHSHHDVLIDMRNFEEFMLTTMNILYRHSSGSMDLIRQAIYKVLPRRDRTVESAILTFFSAIESIILIHRRDKNLEFTISESSNWKKFEKELRKVVREHETLFPTPDHMEMLLKMLPLLKRVPLQEAFLSFVGNSVDLTDLWPVFNTARGASLSDVRNRLIHGDFFDRERSLPLCHAMDNLECIAKRLIMSVLGWNIAESNISKDVLKRYGWIPNSNLAADMLALSET